MRRGEESVRESEREKCERGKGVRDEWKGMEYYGRERRGQWEAKGEGSR